MWRPRLLVAVAAALALPAAVGLRAADVPESLLARSRAALPRLEGGLTVPGLKEPVEVLRDRWGVPHLYAKSADDLFFAQGFIAAQDRLFQMDWWRRTAAGETAEVVGPAGVEADRFSRLVRYRGDLRAEWDSYGPDAERIASAFARGVNACIDHLGGRLPIEFQILGYTPGRWKAEDCLGRVAGLGMSANFRTEVARAELIAAVGLEKARRLAPADPPRAYAPAPGLDLAGVDRTILAGFTAVTRAPSFVSATGGSNNWVVDGTLSASGKPLLANDPHRPLTLPSLRYLVHLNAPGWHVIGSGEPALPGVALGHNERVAWGFTIVGTDAADLYVEETDPADPTRYRVGDRWERMTVVREAIRVRGHPPVEWDLRFTRHGPVVFQDERRHRAYALRWVGSEPGGAGYLGGLALSRTRNWADFLAACRSWKLPAENIVYADVDGNIGWVAAGLTPVRAAGDGLLPVPGASGAYEWRGFRDVRELPQEYNPPRHYLLTANHNILPPNYPHALSHEWAAPYRYLRLREALEAKRKFNAEDFQRLHHDNTTLPGRLLAKLAARLTPEDPTLRPYAEALAKWDGVLSRDSRPGLLYALWLRELTDTAYREVPSHLRDYVVRVGLPALLRALESPDRAWFGDNPIVARDRLLNETFAAAVRRARALLPGSDTKWTWGRLHVAHFRHPLEVGGVGSAFNVGPVPTPGDAYTPNAAPVNVRWEHVHGSTYRQVFDLADWDRGTATSAPGQSGQPGSPHYADLLPLWEKGEYFPLAFSRAKVEAVTRHRLVLRPADGRR